jgi:hypothetical protein
MCDPNAFLSRLATKDKSCLYRYDPKKKQQTMEWRNIVSLLPVQKIPSAKISYKNFASFDFWNYERILLTDYLPKDQTINSDYYSFLQVQKMDF